MDITSDPGAVLLLRQGADAGKVSLAAIKNQAKIDQDMVAMATQSVMAPSSDPTRGSVVDTRA